MLRHIIIEGPDGAGKTTLLTALSEHLGYPQHKRASDSQRGPNLATLDGWVTEDTNQLHRLAPSLYDRHPLVSEPIYGPVCRGRVPGLFNENWWVQSMTTRVAMHSLLILCLPPFDIVKDQASRHVQMSGVMDNLPLLYDKYYNLQWPGVQIRYDRTKTGTLSLVPILRKVMPHVK